MGNTFANGGLIGIIFGIILLVAIAVNALVAWRKGIIKTVGKTAAIIISAIVSFIATMIICAPGSSQMEAGIDYLKSIEGVGTIFENPEIAEIVPVLATALLAPFVFFLIFIVISIIARIVMSIVTGVLKKIFNVKKNWITTLISIVLGAVNGFLIVMIITMPFIGTMEIGDTALSSIIPVLEGSAEAENNKTENVSDEKANAANGIVFADDNFDGTAVEKDNTEKAKTASAFSESELQDLKDINDLLSEANNSVSVKVLGTLGGKALYNGLTSVDYQGEKFVLSNEIKAISGLAGSAIVLTEVPVDQYGSRQVNALDEAVFYIERSVFVPKLASQFLSAASTEWLNGNNYLGIEKIKAPELVEPLVDTMLVIFKDSTSTTVVADFRSVVDVFKVLINNKILANAEQFEEMLNALSSSGAIKEITRILASNERMNPLTDEISRLGVRALASALNLPESDQEVLDDIMADLATTFNDSMALEGEDRVNALAVQCVTSMKEYGLDVDEDTARQVAKDLIADLGENGEVDGDSVQDFFAVYAAALAENNEEAKRYSRFGEDVSLIAYSENGDDEKRNMVIVNDDGSVSVNDRRLKHYDANSYMDSAAYKSGASGINYGVMSTLSDAESLETNIITVEDILSTLTSVTDLEDPAAELEVYADIIVKATSFIKNNDFSELEPTAFINEFGEVLDMFKDSSIFGTESTEKILTSAFQSNVVTEALGMSRSETTEISDAMITAVREDENASYTTVTKTASNVINVVNASTDPEKTNEERLAEIEKLMKDMTPTNAKMLKKMITPSFVEANVNDLGKDKSKAISDAFGVVFTNMGNFKTNHPDATDEDYNRETKALNDFTSLALEAKKNDGNAFGEDGGMNKTAYEFICDYAKSVVLTESVHQMLYTEENKVDLDCLGLAESLSDADKAELEASLERYENEHTEDSNREKTCNDIRRLFGIEKG